MSFCKKKLKSYSKSRTSERASFASQPSKPRNLGLASSSQARVSKLNIRNSTKRRRRRRLVEFLVFNRASLASQPSKANQKKGKKQASKRASERASEQLSKQTTKQASNQPTNLPINQARKQASKQASN